MRIDSEFTVDAPIEEVWAFLLDVPKIAPCAPGAELTEVVDDRTWKGKLIVKLGPISMSFAGTVVLQERDDEAHRGVLKAEGREQRGKGAASAVVTSSLSPTDHGGTKVAIATDLTISGAAAQYGRGMIGDVSQRMAREFASCLEASIAAERSAATSPAATAESPAASPSGADEGGTTAPASPAASPPTRPVAAKPVKGLRLGLWALWRAVVRFFRRQFGRRSN